MAGASAGNWRLLVEAGQLLSSTLELGELLSGILRYASRVVGSQTASLLLLDEKTQELYFDVALGLGEEASKVRLKPGHGIAGAVARDKRSMIIQDVRKDPRWTPDVDAKSGFVTRSILAVPMVIRGRLIGVLEAINKVDGEFGDTDLAAFEAFASQAAVAVENARLFQQVMEERFRLHTVFARMTDGAILSDERGTVLLANDAARRVLAGGAPLERLAAMAGELSMAPTLADILASESPVRGFEVSRPGPKKLLLAGTATRIELGNRAGGGARGIDAGRVWIFRDVTEERNRELLKRTFLSLISHKLKTPLVSIIGYADILQAHFRDRPASEMMLKAAQAVFAQGRKLSDLVDKLLKYVTLESADAAPEIQAWPAQEVAAEAQKEMKDFLLIHNAAVRWDGPGVTVWADRIQLVEALKNLIENAAKFDPRPSKEILVSGRESGPFVDLCVIDSGPGIPPEDMEKILSGFHQVEASFTGQIHGWGLGLPLVKKVAERHGGRLEVRSRLGSGTTVVLSIPRPVGG